MANLENVKLELEKRGIESSIHFVSKNGEKLEALAIGSGTIRPTLYNHPNFSDDEILESALMAIETEPPAIDMNALTDFSVAKELLKLGVRRRIIDNVATIDFLDMQLYAYLSFGHGDSCASTKVTRDLLKHYGISVEELIGKAKENTHYSSKPLTQVMADIVAESEGVDVSMIEVPDMGIEFLCITNEFRYRGASAICDIDLLHSVAEEVDDDLLIFPSSVDEILALPYSCGLSADDAKGLVEFVNASEVSPQDVLSNNVYLYKRSDRSVSIC